MKTKTYQNKQNANKKEFKKKHTNITKQNEEKKTKIEKNPNYFL